MAEYGVFNDEGCLDSGYITFAQADAVAADFRRQGDEYAKASEICPDHEEQPAGECEDCLTDGDLTDAEEEERERNGG